MSKDTATPQQAIKYTLTGEIPRDGHIRELSSEFGTGCQHIMVVGGTQTGKTNLLSQFARHHLGRVISYSITANPLEQQQHVFLYSVCCQLAEVLEQNQPPTNVTTEELKSLYVASTIHLSRLTIRRGPFFFVIDGLEWALEGVNGNRIIDVLPLSTREQGPYVLSSCRIDYVSKLPTHVQAARQVKPREFNFRDTAEYLADLNLSNDDLWILQNRYKGVPGYLKVVRDIRLADPNFDLDGSHPDLERLISRQVNLVLESVEPPVKMALHYLAVSPAALPTDLLQSLCDLDKNHRQTLIDSPLVRVDSTLSSLEYNNEVTRQAVLNISSIDISKLQNALIDFLESEPQRNESLLLILLKETRDYQRLQKLLSNSSLITTVVNTGDIASVIKGLNFAAELASQKGDMNEVMKWSLGVAAARAFTSHIVDESEIRSLLAIGESQEALRKVYALPENASKIRLLARSYSIMRENGQLISKSSKQELAALVHHLHLADMEEDAIKQIAIDLFPILPDVAVTLLEGATAKAQDRGIVDVAISSIVTELQEEKESSTIISIKDEGNPGKFLPFSAQWLKDMGWAKLQDELKSVDHTKAREYLLRQWCLQNRDSQYLAEAVHKWLDLVVGSDHFVVTLRSLRQISAILLSIDEVNRYELISRLRAPLFTSIDSPKEEWVRFRLNLAEALYDINPTDAQDNVREIYADVIGASTELDTTTYCLARIRETANRIMPEENHFHSSVIESFDHSFTNLLRDSADHFAVIRRTISALVDVDPEAALITAIHLNTRSRRIRALRVVLINTLRKYGNTDISTLVNSAITELEPEDRENILTDALVELNAREVQLHTANFSVLSAHTEAIVDPYFRSLALTNLAVLMFKSGLDGASATLEKSIQSWRLEDDLKLRMTLGYKLVEESAKIDIKFAKELYQEVQQLQVQPGSSLASGELGDFFVEVLLMVIRSLTSSHLSATDDAIRHLYILISHVPSKHVRTNLYAELAASMYRSGNNTYADKIVREKVLEELSRMQKFIFDIELHFSSELDRCYISPNMQKQFKEQKKLKVTLSPQASVEVHQEGQKWTIADNGICYLICKQHQTLSVYTQNAASRKMAIEQNLPVICKYDLDTATDLSTELSESAQNRAWYMSIMWLLTEGLIGDSEVDPRKIRVTGDYPKLQKATSCLRNLTYDLVLVSAITAIANVVEASFVSTLIDPLQAFDILQRLDSIAENRLPDSENIQHEGFLVVANSVVHKVRSLIHKNRKSQVTKGLTTKDISQSWRKIIAHAKTIPNTADRVYVLSLVARDLMEYYSDNPGIAKDVLDEAYALLSDIPTFTDRVGRLEALAESWQHMGNSTVAEKLIELAMENVQKLDGVDYNQRLGLLVQSAYKVNTRLAEELVTRYDSRSNAPVVNPAELIVLVERLIEDPAQISIPTNEGRNFIIKYASEKLLSDLVSGLGTHTTSEVFLEWLSNTRNSASYTCVPVANWILESLHRRHQTIGGGHVIDPNTLVDIAVLVSELAKLGSSERRGGIPEAIQDSFPGLSAKVEVFNSGEIDRATRWIRSWLSDNCKQYVKICDPYFGFEQLDFLRYVPTDCKVLIVTTDSELDVSNGEQQLKTQLQIYWKKVSAQKPPLTQFLIVPRTLDDQFHDRVIITSDTGLNIGQSLNGLGKKRGNITILSAEDAKELEQSYVDSMLSQGTWFMNHGVSSSSLFFGER